MILLDTTILAYAAGAEHPLRGPCRGLLEAAADRSLRASTTIGVVQELAHIRARRRSSEDAAEVARNYAIGLSPLVRPALEDLLEGLDLFEQSSVLGSFDAVLAATARRRGMALASADRSFRGVEGLTFLDPGSASFLEAARALE